MVFIGKNSENFVTSFYLKKNFYYLTENIETKLIL